MAAVARSVEPLELGGPLFQVDTTTPVNTEPLADDIRRALATPSKLS